MHDRFESRMEEGFKALQAGAQSGRLKDIGVALQRLERLKQKYTRAAGAFDVQIPQVTPQDPKPQKPNKVKLNVSWTRNST